MYWISSGTKEALQHRGSWLSCGVSAQTFTLRTLYDSVNLVPFGYFVKQKASSLKGLKTEGTWQVCDNIWDVTGPSNLQIWSLFSGCRWHTLAHGAPLTISYQRAEPEPQTGAWHTLGECSPFVMMQLVRERLSVMLGSLQNARVPGPGSRAGEVGLWLSKAVCHCLSCLRG